MSFTWSDKANTLCITLAQDGATQQHPNQIVRLLTREQPHQGIDVNFTERYWGARVM